MKKTLRAAALMLVCTSVFAQGKAIVRDGAFGCSEKDAYQKLVRFAVQKDSEAFNNGLLRGMLAGRCAMFHKGDGVYLEDTAVLSGLIKIRRKGETGGYWTAMENAR